MGTTNVKMIVAFCAAVLLAAACISGQLAHAEGRLAGIKALFFQSSYPGQSYVALANHLYKATQSTELDDNTEAAGSLLSEQTDSKQDVVELVQAFGSLKGVSSGPENFCSKQNLANLRRVAEGLRDGGNLGPKDITNAISRLNRIVIKIIEDTSKICSPYLAGKWPEPWQPNFSGTAMKDQIVNLYEVANSFLYEGFMNPPGDLSYEPTWNPYLLSYVIKKSERQADNPIDPDEPNPLRTENTTVIAKQFEEYVYKPCSEFVRFDESKEVLSPFNDMLKSWYLVIYNYLNKYYKNEHSYRPPAIPDNIDVEVRHRAFSYQACQRLLATPRKDLANMVRKYRALKNRPSSI